MHIFLHSASPRQAINKYANDLLILTDNPEPVSTTVDKVSVLSLEADIDLLVSVASDVPGTSRVGEGRNLSLRTRGRGFWKRFLA